MAPTKQEAMLTFESIWEFWRTQHTHTHVESIYNQFRAKRSMPKIAIAFSSTAYFFLFFPFLFSWCELSAFGCSLRALFKASYEIDSFNECERVHIIIYGLLLLQCISVWMFSQQMQTYTNNKSFYGWILKHIFAHQFFATIKHVFIYT